MITMDWRGEEDFYKSVYKLEKRYLDNTSDFVRFAARWLEMDIRTSWSPKSPSSPHKAPAVDTGNLNASVKAEPQGRQSGGRFGTDTDSISWYVRVDTASGNGKSYSQALEEGVPVNNWGFEMKPRPFMRPAIDRLKGIFPEMAHREIRK